MTELPASPIAAPASDCPAREARAAERSVIGTVLVGVALSVAVVLELAAIGLF